MTTHGVLLVDDVPGERANFEYAFGGDFTVAPSIDQLNEQLRRGLCWELAFIDFNLSSQTSTGLTALLRLHHERPATQIVTYSQFTESGRTLYAAAAHHWFRASALMDKTKNDPSTLVHYRQSVCDGIDPTPVPWQRRLQSAPLIDNLPADASWVRIWRALRDAAGDMALVPRCCTSTRAACEASRTAPPRPPSSSTRSSMTSRTPVVPGTRRASWQPSQRSTVIF
jgi:hypothetical protein